MLGSEVGERFGDLQTVDWTQPGEIHAYVCVRVCVSDTRRDKEASEREADRLTDRQKKTLYTDERGVAQQRCVDYEVGAQ